MKTGSSAGPGVAEEKVASPPVPLLNPLSDTPAAATPMAKAIEVPTELTWAVLVSHLEAKFSQDVDGRGRRDTILRGVRLTAWAEAANVERVTISRLMRDDLSAGRTRMGTMDSLAAAAGWSVDTLKWFLREASRRYNQPLMGPRTAATRQGTVGTRMGSGTAKKDKAKDKAKVNKTKAKHKRK